MSDILKRLRADTVGQGIQPPERWTHDGKVYIRGDLAEIDSSRYRSNWWTYGAKYALAGQNAIVAGWLCCTEGCPSRFIVISEEAAHMAQRHMEEKHQMKKLKTTICSSQHSSDASESEYRTLLHTVNEKKIQAQLLRFFIIKHLPFNKANSPEFRSLLKLLQPQMVRVAYSATSLRRWARDAFTVERARVKSLLSEAASKIHISFDIWTSPNRFAVFGIVAHFVRPIHAEDKVVYRNQAVLLGMKRMQDRHGAKEMSEEIIQSILDFEIGQRLGCFQADNPTFNDNTVRDVLVVLDPTEADPASRRARCIGHVIHLAAKDLIFGTDVDASEFDIAGEKVAKFNRQKLQRAQDV